MRRWEATFDAKDRSRKRDLQMWRRLALDTNWASHFVRFFQEILQQRVFNGEKRTLHRAIGSIGALHGHEKRRTREMAAHYASEF